MVQSSYVFEITVFCIYILGITFVYLPYTEYMGLLVLAFGTACFFSLTTQWLLTLGRFDWIAFSLFASSALLVASMTLVILFFYRFNSIHSDFIMKPSTLSGLARDVITLFETIFIPIFILTLILFILFVRNGNTSAANATANGIVPLMTKLIFSLWNGGAFLTKEEQQQRSYILIATPFAMVVLALTSYEVYIANVLQYIQ